MSLANANCLTQTDINLIAERSDMGPQNTEVWSAEQGMDVSMSKQFNYTKKVLLDFLKPKAIGQQGDSMIPCVETTHNIAQLQKSAMCVH